MNLRIGSTGISLPIELTSGDYQELGADGECTVHGHDGRRLAKVILDGYRPPVLESGWNDFNLHAEPVDGKMPPPRARVTVLMEAHA